MPVAYLLGTAATTPFDNVDFTTIQTYAETVGAKAIVPLVTVLALVVGMRLVKRFGSMIG